MRQTSTIIIHTEAENEAYLRKIEALMNKGSAHLSKEENDQIRNMALAVQAFERKHYKIPVPQTMEQMIALKMYQMNLKQKELADQLEISPTKLSLILRGKQRPDLSFIKGLYTKLHIPADFILEHI